MCTRKTEIAYNIAVTSRCQHYHKITVGGGEAAQKNYKKIMKESDKQRKHLVSDFCNHVLRYEIKLYNIFIDKKFKIENSLRQRTTMQIYMSSVTTAISMLEKHSRKRIKISLNTID